MDKHIIALDMDGTLLDNSGKVSDRNMCVLRKLIDEGHYVVPASGRALPLLPNEVKNLKGIKYAVLENGAVIWDWENDIALKKHKIPEGMTQNILNRLLEEYPNAVYYTEIFSDGKAYVEQRDIEKLKDANIYGNFAEYMLNNHVFVENLKEQPEFLNTAEKINIYFEDITISEKFRAEWKNIHDINVTTSVNGNAEFNKAGINKGIGLKELAQRLGISKRNIIAMGDNDNDLEMLEQAGTAAAMGNAADDIKEVADIVAEDNDSDGVAVFLEQYFGID